MEIGLSIAQVKCGAVHAGPFGLSSSMDARLRDRCQRAGSRINFCTRQFNSSADEEFIFRRARDFVNPAKLF